MRESIVYKAAHHLELKNNSSNLCYKKNFGVKLPAAPGGEVLLRTSPHPHMGMWWGGFYTNIPTSPHGDVGRFFEPAGVETSPTSPLTDLCLGQINSPH